VEVATLTSVVVFLPLILVGVVVNNAIVLVDLTNRLRLEVWGWRRLVGWIVAWVENCQLEAATPGPRIAVFAFWRQRLSGSPSTGNATSFHSGC